MKSQMASPAFSPVYAALIAVINTKFPELGELLLGRVILQVPLSSQLLKPLQSSCLPPDSEIPVVILQFRRAYKRNDKSVCLAATKMIAHLVNQQVCLPSA